MNSIVLPYFSAGVQFAGAVDYLDPHHGIRGWVMDPRVAGVPLALEAWCSGIRLAESIAILDRPDIDSVLGRTTQCGFLIGWSRFDQAAMQALAAKNPDAPLDFVVAGEECQIPVVREPILIGHCLALLRTAPQGDRTQEFSQLNDYLDIAWSQLFDEDWYRRTQLGLDPGMPPILDYLRRGEARGAMCSLYFDPQAYAAEAELDSSAGALSHYLRTGAMRGLNPSLHFDNRWYRSSFRPPAGVVPLAHFMAGRAERAPHRWFDPAYYLDKSGAKDVADPYEHYLREGRAAGLAPAPAFDPERARGVAPPREGLAFLKLLARHVPPPLVTDAAVRRLLPQAAAPMPALVVVAPPPAPVAKRETKPDRSASPSEAKPRLVTPGPTRMEAGKPVEPTRPRKSAEPAKSPVAGKPTGGGGMALPGQAAPYAAAETQLLALGAKEVEALVKQAERDLEGKPALRAAAALTLAVARGIAGDRVGAARAQLTFLATPEGSATTPANDIMGRIAAVNHVLYEERNQVEAAEVYRLLHGRGFKDGLVCLRLLEIALGGNDLAAAAPLAAELAKDYADRLNIWGVLALSRFHGMNGETTKSVEILRAQPLFPAVEAAAEAVICQRLLENGALDEVAARLAAVGDSPLPALFQVRFRLAVKRGAVAEIIAADEQRCANEVPDWLLAEAMFLSTVPGTMPSAATKLVQRALYRLLESRGLQARPAVQSRIHYLLHNKRWDELGVLFKQLEDTPLGSDRETLLRKLEYYCHADNAEEAERIYQSIFVGTELNKWESLTILRLLGELKRWEEAAKVLLHHVVSGFGFAGGSHVAMRVVRKTATHQAILDRVRAMPAAAPAKRDADLGEFLHLVNEDLVIVQSARALTANLQPGQATPRYRSNWLLTNTGTGAEHADYCLYLCTNQRYFLSLLTFLCSFLGQAPQVGGRVFVFLDRDVPRHWYGSIAMVAARFGRAIDIVPEDDFMPKDGVDHRVEYGFFTSGGNLSRAAYFRLYAARYLLACHSFRRAVYTDTDIICRSDMTGMFALNLGDKLIAARVEDYTPEVLNAATRNAIDPQAYFNSGVLLLKFDDPRLSEFIEEAIRIAEKEPDRLVFHDQCALNIAFQDRFTRLPDRYNFYLRPSRERNGYIEDGVLLHYLDKPKPWDIVFDRSYREEWRVWALVLGSILPQGLYVDIFAAGNRD